MISAWGIDHGVVSKGLPSAVKAGGGGRLGHALRQKNQAGKTQAMQTSMNPTRAPEHNKRLGGLYKEEATDIKFRADVDRTFKGKGTRRTRAGLLNEDIASRRRGMRMGKYSGLDRGYRGRVSNEMTPLP